VVTISVADSTARIVQYVDVYVPVGSESEDMVSFVAPQAKSLKVQNSLQG
jgi:ribosome biogenesis GTPase A